jgi:hypothetical protein
VHQKPGGAKEGLHPSQTCASSGKSSHTIRSEISLKYRTGFFKVLDLSLLGTLATNWGTVPAPDDR